MFQAMQGSRSLSQPTLRKNGFIAFRLEAPGFLTQLHPQLSTVYTFKTVVAFPNIFNPKASPLFLPQESHRCNQHKPEGERTGHQDEAGYGCDIAQQPTNRPKAGQWGRRHAKNIKVAVFK